VGIAFGVVDPVVDDIIGSLAGDLGNAGNLEGDMGGDARAGTLTGDSGKAGNLEGDIGGDARAGGGFRLDVRNGSLERGIPLIRLTKLFVPISDAASELVFVVEGEEMLPSTGVTPLANEERVANTGPIVPSPY
jgi:hypothetical protein